ncbi:hypothetical protein A3860_38075 [Niastella vici]|uniref:Uncharacterized protein n=1 Tax=Niastella vici TaxID=1703345 RepID=A0A1V9FLN5_9BACT|nr:hypothetical protein [Niastella vici]OQP59265.1 hypothetical protein A3860_38075 [Niastella vici]
MKTRKNIYLGLGIAIITIDIFLTCIVYYDFKRSYRHLNYTIILLPLQVLLIPALLFLFGAYRVQKKINRQNRNALLNAIN